MILSFLKKLSFLNKDLTETESALNYRFKNKNYIRIAMTHKSLNSDHSENYERLEFLGDSILGSVLTDWLFKKYPDADEGFLTNQRSSFVNKYFLAVVARHLKIDQNIRVDRCVNLEDDKVLNNIISDIYEALIGAIFIDGGYKAAKRVIIRTVIDNVQLANHENNYKGRLIEYCHRNQFKGPKFLHHFPEGPEHEKVFNVELLLGNDKTFYGTGKSKKEAEQKAAKRALEHLF